MEICSKKNIHILPSLAMILIRWLFSVERYECLGVDLSGSQSPPDNCESVLQKANITGYALGRTKVNTYKILGLSLEDKKIFNMVFSVLRLSSCSRYIGKNTSVVWKGTLKSMPYCFMYFIIFSTFYYLAFFFSTGLPKVGTQRKTRCTGTENGNIYLFICFTFSSDAFILLNASF